MPIIPGLKYVHFLAKFTTHFCSLLLLYILYLSFLAGKLKYFHSSPFQPSSGNKSVASSTKLTPSISKSLARVIIILIFTDAQVQSPIPIVIGKDRDIDIYCI